MMPISRFFRTVTPFSTPTPTPLMICCSEGITEVRSQPATSSETAS